MQSSCQLGGQNLQIQKMYANKKELLTLTFYTYKVNLEYCTGQPAPHGFVKACSLEAARTAATEKYNLFKVAEIIKDTTTVDQRLFRVAYAHTVSYGYDEGTEIHHRGFVVGHSEQEAWQAANSICAGQKYWVQRTSEAKVKSLAELMEYLAKNVQ